MNEQGTRWTSNTKLVDMETGEFLTKHNAKTNYIHVKTIKNVTFNKLKTRGTIHWTKLYQRSKQINIFK